MTEEKKSRRLGVGAAGRARTCDQRVSARLTASAPSCEGSAAPPLSCRLRNICIRRLGYPFGGVRAISG